MTPFFRKKSASNSTCMLYAVFSLWELLVTSTGLVSELENHCPQPTLPSRFSRPWVTRIRLESSSLTLSLNSAERRAEQTLASVAAWGGAVAKDVSWPVNSHGSDKIKAWVRGLTPDTLSVKALESEALVADAGTSVARSAVLPSVDLGGAWKKTLAEGASGPLDHHEVVATLSVPLFNKFSDSGEYRARVQEATAANASLEAARAISHREFKFAAIELIASIDEAKVRDEQITTADRLYRDNLQRFERGLITVNELSLDEHRVRDAELAAISTWQRVHQELFRVAELAGQSVLSVL